MINNWLFKRIDNSALIVFRIIFGLLIAAQAWGSILTGYVQKYLITPEFTFSFIGFDFIQPLPSVLMYVFYGFMGLLGIAIAVGYRYKLSMSLFTVLWAYSYLMIKESYNNHYYLLLLLSIFMCIAPANRYFSIDAKQNPNLRQLTMPHWVRLWFIVQMTIVYTFAALAKLYPDWLDGRMAEILLQSKADLPIIGSWLQHTWAIHTLTYFGILFDLLISPLLLWKPTRKVTFIAAIFFHLFNSIVFQIGIFPYLALGLFIFYFPPQSIKRIFFKVKPQAEAYLPKTPSNQKSLIVVFLSLWFIVQLFLPIRHWFIKGDVLWTEEGHRLSWRMMLRSRSGHNTFKIVNKTTGDTSLVKQSKYLTPKQIRAVATKPDMIWQFCQRLKREYAQKGQDIAIYVTPWVSINGHRSQLLISPNTDMAQVDWNYFGHNSWILVHKDFNDKNRP